MLEMKSNAADPGMTHIGSSSVIDAKQAGHESEVYSGEQGYGTPPTSIRLTISLTRSTATTLQKGSPVHRKKPRRII